MRFKVVLLLVGMLMAGFSYGQRVELSEIKAPSHFDNIHVVKMATDANSSDFIIFIQGSVPLHKHLQHTESLYILEGAGEFYLGGKTFQVGAGDYIKVPQGVAHGVKVVSKKPMKVLSVQAPEFFGKDRHPVE
ncbi:MAG: cupin domain-containing protein [Pseudomonadales bacterium]|nr:cupin domain-containing protein [Pseudomonadales bacterium]